MAEHKAAIHWERQGPDFLKGKYSREHTWTFDGGITVAASPAPSVVPAPWSNAANVDPEEAFVASVSSCHMLTFLHCASRAGFEADSYHDDAVGTMSKNERGAYWVSSIRLSPRIAWSAAKPPSAAEVHALHEAAHLQCFIANSVKTSIEVV